MCTQRCHVRNRPQRESGKKGVIAIEELVPSEGPTGIGTPAQVINLIFAASSALTRGALPTRQDSRRQFGSESKI
jgi:hypothetical protein